MFIEKNIRPHDFKRGGPKWVIRLEGTSYTEGYIFAPYLPSISTDINNGYYSTTTLIFEYP